MRYLLVLLICLTFAAPALAQDAPTVTKWEYAALSYNLEFNLAVAMTGDVDTTTALQDGIEALENVTPVTALNVFGDAGFELVGIDVRETATLFYFKRPKA